MENVKQNTMKYKILFIFSFLLLILFLNTNVFASYDVTIQDTTYNLPDWFNSKEYNLFLYGIDYRGEYTAMVFSSDSPIILNPNNSGYFYNSDNSDFLFWFKHSSTTFTDISDLVSYSMNSTKTVYCPGSDYLSSCVSYSNHDILNNSGTVVFQAPVQEITPTLAQVLEEEPKQVTAKIQETLTILIPVGIIVLAILLVVYLIASKRWLPM